ncbi:MAG: 50S ribosomal protein L29 [Patescibacteria group bacterium]|nr:50S ribosomal protein L29 [Patescibacteria group bacterium]
MKAKELRNKTLSELRRIAEDLRKRINQLLIDKSLNKLSKPHLLKLAKKDLARVLTIIRENEKAINR